ncbi:magnesium-dependent phosphatase [Chloropicon primus]|nr:magnesium-dependent phosphatase [Chloropicon primus]UPR04589.1 magnesium-dependent phosphatase [Chloropicon primus]|eukprot:QDZ25391.1 magnesium-dependent phosphatase [Chloropicon primus]
MSKSGPRLPRLIAFDLDDTLWFPEMYLLIGGAPFRKDKQGRLISSGGEEVELYPAARACLKELATSPKYKDIKVVFASRCHETDWAYTCMDLLDVCDGVSVSQCLNEGGVFQGGSKQGHFAELKRRTGIEYEEMVFFDNERWNITEVKKLGVTCVHTPNGMQAGQFEKGLALYAEKWA